jgi:threonine dehydratase
MEVKLTGDTFDDCAVAPKNTPAENGMTFIPPFDDIRIIEGQATVGIEILEDQADIDYLFVPRWRRWIECRGGCLFQNIFAQNKIDRLEPEGAPAMYEALKAGNPVTLETIERFVDGAAVKRVGDLTFSICKGSTG